MSTKSDFILNDGASNQSSSNRHSDSIDKQFRAVLEKYQIDYIRTPKKGRFLPTFGNYVQFTDQNIKSMTNAPSPYAIYVLVIFFIIIETQFAQFTLLNQINTFNEEDKNAQDKYLNSLLKYTLGEFVGSIIGIIVSFYFNSALLSIIFTGITLTITMVRFYFKLQFNIYLIIGLYVSSFVILKGKIICDYCYMNLDKAFMRIQIVQQIIQVIINTDLYDSRFMQVSRLKQKIDLIDYFFSYNTNYVFTILGISGMISMYLQLIKIQQGNNSRIVSLRYKTRIINAFFFPQRKVHHIVYVQIFLYCLLRTVCNSNWPFVYNISKESNNVEYSIAELSSIFWYTQLVSTIIVEPLLRATMCRPIYSVGFGIIYLIIFIQQIFFRISIVNMIAVSFSFGIINIMANPVTIAMMGEFVPQNCDINRLENQTQLILRLFNMIHVAVAYILNLKLKNPMLVKYLFIVDSLIIIVLACYIFYFDSRKLNYRLHYSY